MPWQRSDCSLTGSICRSTMFVTNHLAVWKIPITIPTASVAPRSSQRHEASIRGNIDAADLLRPGAPKTLTVSEGSG